MLNKSFSYNENRHPEHLLSVWPHVLPDSNSRLCGQGSTWWGKWQFGVTSAEQRLFIQWRMKIGILYLTEWSPLPDSNSRPCEWGSSWSAGGFITMLLNYMLLLHLWNFNFSPPQNRNGVLYCARYIQGVERHCQITSQAWQVWFWYCCAQNAPLYRENGLMILNLVFWFCLVGVNKQTPLGMFYWIFWVRLDTCHIVTRSIYFCEIDLDRIGDLSDSNIVFPFVGCSLFGENVKSWSRHFSSCFLANLNLCFLFAAFSFLCCSM